MIGMPLASTSDTNELIIQEEFDLDSKLFLNTEYDE